MSGFFGIFCDQAVRDGDVRTDCDDAAEVLAARLEPRGPHGLGRWQDAQVVIGHRLLRETPESTHESQPLLDASARYVLAFDGRLDNRNALFSVLGDDAPRASDCPDAALVLAAFLRFGYEAPERLLGDFAFLIWDRTARRLFCARDPLAGRPLYFAKTRLGLFVCSSDEAMVGVLGVSAAGNEVKAASLLLPTLVQDDEFSSWRRDVCVLHPGSTLSWSPTAAARETRYWHFKHPAELRLARHEDYVDAFAAALDGALARRLRSYGAPGMLLSGGIDSASIITAARHEPKSLAALDGRAMRTYSAALDDSAGCVETRAIEALIAAGACEPHLVRLPSFHGSPFTKAEFTACHWAIGHPIEASLLNHIPLLEQARRDGCTSILTGVGGDITTGYPDAVFPMGGSTFGRIREMLTLSRSASKHHTYMQGARCSTILARSLLRTFPAALRDPIRRARATLRISPSYAAEIEVAKKIFNEDFFRRNQLLERLREFASPTPFISAIDPSSGEQVSLDWLAHGQVGYDRIAGHFGLAHRDAWCDLDLIGFYLSVPLAHRAHGAWTKALVRDYLDRHAPESVARRSDKTHIGWRFYPALEQVHTVARDTEKESIALEKLELAKNNYSFANIGFDDLFHISRGVWSDSHSELMHRVDLLSSVFRFGAMSATSRTNADLDARRV